MASLGPDAAHRNQPLKEALLLRVEKAEQRNLIVADMGMNVQRGLRAHRGQRRETLARRS